jgi:hypothetical protein
MITLRGVIHTIDTDLFERILTWNRDRNGLSFDPRLEIKMLSEESSEVMMASPDDIPHVLQEVADFVFVAIGTYGKYFNQVHTSSGVFDAKVKEWAELCEWADKAWDIMWSRVTRLLQNDGITNSEDRYDVLTAALQCVTSANERKPNQKKDGKVVKGDSHSDPRGGIAKCYHYLRRLNE